MILMSSLRCGKFLKKSLEDLENEDFKRALRAHLGLKTRLILNSRYQIQVILLNWGSSDNKVINTNNKTVLTGERT